MGTRHGVISLALLVLLAALLALLYSLRSAGEPRDGTRLLFHGWTLVGWQIADDDYFERHGDVQIRAGAIHLAIGDPATGVRCLGPVPRANYEIALEAMRTEGSDFFCGLTFPIHESHCTLIVGGWGGATVGLSNIDGFNASENETTTDRWFENERWYRIRLRVTNANVSAWIENEQVIDLPTQGHTFTIWWEQEPIRPLGIAAWQTGAALRRIRLTPLSK